MMKKANLRAHSRRGIGMLFGAVGSIKAKHLTLILALAVSLAATAATADVIVMPNTPTGNVAPNAGSSYPSVVNSSGLSAAVAAGMDTAAALLVTQSAATADTYVTYSVGAGKKYFVDGGTVPVLTFDLGSKQDYINSIILWNYANTVNCVTEFSLAFYSDASATVQIGSTITGLTASVDTANAQQIFLPEGISVVGVRSIKLTLTNNNDGNRVGFGEVRFSKFVPQPAVIVTPNTPTGNVGPSAGSSYASLVDSSGLSASVPTGMDVASALVVAQSTLDPVDTYVTGPVSSDYFDGGGTVPVLTFDLGGTFYKINSIVLWNYYNGVNDTIEFSLAFYSDASATVQIGSTMAGLKVASDAANAQRVFFPGGIEFNGVQAIKMTLTDNNGGNRVGLGEVRFAKVTPVPIASTWNNVAAGAYSWSTAANWSGGVPSIPGLDADAITFFSDTTTALGSGTYTIATDDPATLIMNSLTLKGLANAGGNTVAQVGTAGRTWTLDGSTPTVNLNGLNNGSRVMKIDVKPNIALAQANTVFTGDGTGTFILSGDISGSGKAITKSGASTLVVTGSGSFTGGTTINGGTVSMGEDSGGNQNVGSLGGGSGSITVNSGGQLRLGGVNSSAFYDTFSDITLNGGSLFAVDARQVLRGDITVGAGGGTIYNNQGGFFRQMYLRGALNGSGPLTLANGGGSSGAAVRFGNTQSSYSGTVTVNNADCILLVENDHTLSNGTVNVTVNDGVELSIGTATTLGGLTGTGDISLPSGYNLTVGANNKPTTYGGVFYNSGSFSKTGTGTLTLTAANTYSGPTTVSAGTLLVNGSHTGGGTYSVSPGAVLGGTGTINASAATVSGVVTPGSGGLGMLTFNGNVTWNGGSSASSATDWQMDLGAGNTADLLSIAGNFTKGSGSHFRFDFGGSTEVGLFKLVEWTGATTFSADDFSAINIGGGHTVQFQINGKELDVLISAGCGSPPTITLGTSPTVCLGATVASLPYSAVSGTPDKYTIDYNDAANAAGFIDVGLTALSAPPGTFSVSIPLSAPAGVYAGTVQVIDSGTGCQSSSMFTVTVGDVPAQPGGITQDNPSGSAVCTGSIGVTYTVSAVAFSTNYVWSVPGGASITAGQGTTQITVDWGAAGSGNVSVYAQGVCGNGSARNSAITVGTVIPNAPEAQEPTAITTSSFQANWGSVSGAMSYRLDVATTPDFSSGFVVNNETVSGTSRSFSGLSSANSYYYRVRSYSPCGISADSETIGLTLPEQIAAWDMHGISGVDYGASPMAPTTYASTRVDVVGLTRGPGVQTDGTAAGRGWGGTSWNAPNGTAAIGNGQYATFEVQAKSGMAVSFNRMNVFMYRRDATGPTAGILQYSTDGTTFFDIAGLTYSSSDSAGAALIEVPVDLSSYAALQNVPHGVTVIFRIVNYGASDAAGDWYLYDVGNSSANDLQVLGTFCTTPTTYTVTIDNGGVYCNGSGGTAVRLSGSQSGVLYQLYRDGSPVGAPVSGTGGSISLGAQTALGTYTVEATRTAGGCTASMSGSPVLTMTTPPSQPTGLLGTPGENQADLSWTAPAETLTGYTVKRSGAIDGPFIALAAGNVAAGTLTFSDTTAVNGSTYYYVVSAINGPCESPNSSPVEVVMPLGACPGGVPPTLTPLANQTVLVGSSLDVTITAQDSLACPSPTMTDAGLPITGVTLSDSTGAGSRSRRIQWTPDNSQVGAYPVTITATDSDQLSATRTFIIYVGLQGEPTPGGIPQSQTNWSVPITDLTVPASGNATLTWSTADGVAYDVYDSTQPPGSGGSWSKVVNQQVASGGSEQAAVVQSGSMRFYQVVPSGQNVTERGVWGFVRPSVPTGVSFISPPLPQSSSDLDFSGNLGTALAAALTDPGDRIYVMAPGASPGWTTLRVIDGAWHEDGDPQPYTTPLNPGQGFLVARASGSTSPTFSGRVGNDGTAQISLEIGYNMIGISEGKALSASSAFNSASPVGNYDENLADQVIMLNPNGSFRRLIRFGNNLWYDTATQSTTTLKLLPGQSYYYIRRSSRSTLSF